MGVVFDEVIASVEAPADTAPAETPPAADDGGCCKREKIIDAVESRERWAERLRAD